MKKINISKKIDHTLLAPNATLEQFKKLCDEAVENEFYSVCVPPFMVKSCKKCLADTDIKICTVVGFPLGYNSYLTKMVEAKELINNGADEIDAVINISALKSGDFDFINKEVKSLRQACGKNILKIIIETAYLTDKEKTEVSKIILKNGADFIKTSTGFAPSGAKIEDVKLIKSVVGKNIRIKAAGGISTYEQAVAMIDAGASRIGSSKSLNIVK
ncbi:deoxyribose-phosphate aldolase [Candidatus Ruminimicrobium bovinum]|uniref:deoxyribose-phosphate aldolase n=1 Tax=Candidatus Ruminimicrobium bovinum TaxID=3242779 RepID=UPI0039B8F27F